jgi:hypothetical protein
MLDSLWIPAIQFNHFQMGDYVLKLLIEIDNI